MNQFSNKYTPKPCDIAVIGMGCLFPGAPDLHTYWENILNKINAIREIPEDRWDWRQYYSEDRYAKDKVYSKWGAFIDDFPFDPVTHGIPPNSLSSIEPIQLLALEVVNSALEDAGYKNRPFPRERTSVIFGISGSGELGQKYSFRSALPMFFGNSSEKILSHHGDSLPEWTQDSFPGILMNVTAGRIANRFDLGGVNCTIDAACASSLSALYMSVRELEVGASDIVIVGGADCMQNPFSFICFSKTQALSPSGRSAPLDENADGIVLGEGLAAIVLKRLSDAEQDGDNIYAVIKGVGASSDGRDKSLTAPRREGQVTALKRAYEKANISPKTIGLIEAHATGTAVGDRVEIESLNEVFRNDGSAYHNCAVGSVKSMIGHTKATAGLAGFIKVALSLRHKILPATIGVNRLNDGLKIPDSPFYVNTETKPWLNHSTKHPRRAGVSAFGFGGTNYHIVLEEYTRDDPEHIQETSFQQWPDELFVWKKDSPEELLEAIIPLENAITQGAKPSLNDLAYTINKTGEEKDSHGKEQTLNLAVVTSSVDDLKDKLNIAIKALRDSNTEVFDLHGIYMSEKPFAKNGKLAFLFPGQGSQYLNMFSDLAIQFPEIQTWFERADQILVDRLDKPLSSYIFPFSVIRKEDRRSCEKELAQTQIAQPAIGTVNLAMFNLLKALEVMPDMVAGHSYGEYVALSAAGVFEEDDLIALSEARGRFIHQTAGSDSGTMAAAGAGEEVVDDIIKEIEGVWIANINSPKQTVISGKRSSVKEAVSLLKSKGITTHRFPISSAFHSPIVSRANELLRDFLSNVNMNKPGIKVYSNTTAKPYLYDTEAISSQLVQHLVSRVEFVREIEAMYNDGARIFVEVGPGRVLTSLVSKILKDRPHIALISNQADRSGLSQLQHLLGQLIVNGIQVNMEKIYEGRSLKTIDLKGLFKETYRFGITPTTWLVSGARSISFKDAMEANSKKVIEPMDLKTKTMNNNSSVKMVDSVPEFSHTNISSYNGKEQVMIQHQKLMQRFLETQKNVMMSYMQGTATDNKLYKSKISAIVEDHISQTEDTEKKAAENVHEKPSLPVEDYSDRSITSESREENILDKEASTPILLKIVSELTGYPEDTLDLDLNLEADLGIDSIKRVEILTSLTQALFPDEHGGPPEEFEEVNMAKTLREIIERIEKFTSLGGKLDTEDITKPPKEGAIDSESDFKENLVLPRFTLTTVDAPIQSNSLDLDSSRVIIITDDERGIARSLKDKLNSKGYRVAIVQWGRGCDQKEEQIYCLNDNSEEEIKNTLEAVQKQNGKVGGLIHLFPLKECSSFKDMDLSSWMERISFEVKSLFSLLKYLGTDLRESANNGGACVMSAVGMGGSFASGFNSNKNNFFPGHGGISGLLKTVAIEWPEVRVKSIDLHLTEPVSDLADNLLIEIGAKDDLVEVGYDGKRRLRLGLSEMPLESRHEISLQIDSSWVILITGGARGITAQVAVELAKRYKPTLILVGRSLYPSSEESPDTLGIEHPEKIKKIIIENMRHQGKNFSLVDVENEYRKLCNKREIRSNIKAMRGAGAKVEYFQVDVRNEKEFGSLIDEIYTKYGKLHGVIHGAGIIEDKLIKDKTLDSFDRVLGTKTESAFILSKKLRPESLELLVLFSSVAGRFGNQGQCDYAAANEVINKLAVYLNDQWPGRVVSINWGPWDKSGMVSTGLKEEFAKRGVRLIPPVAGSRFMDNEIKKGKMGEVELIIGDGPWGAVEDISQSN